MPPLRTTPPAKAVKTERTHEENQERAYIAASRRSDRSLEARVESARRASEIHKRRTGRSLRVTEQDVINEEMYEEEDDDLPLQYRRLTAHLQTGSADFNRRLAAYLTNQVAMRSVIEHMAQNPYNQLPNGPYQQRPNMFPSPMPSQQGMVQSAPSQFPYPSPHHPNFRQSHHRAYSVASVPNAPGQAPASPSVPSGSLDHRRMSTPASMQQGDMNSGHHVNTDGLKSDSDFLRQTQPATFSPQGESNSFPPLWQDMGPFTTSLPPESQQMLGNAPGFDPNDPSWANLMHGADQYISDPYYPWHNMQGGIKGMPVHPAAYQGMSITLAPSALEHVVDGNAKSTNTSASTPAATNTNALPTAGSDFNFSQESKGLDFGGGRGCGVMATGSSQATPAGEGFWDNFIDGGWEDGVNDAYDAGSGGGSHAGSVVAGVDPAEMGVKRDDKFSWPNCS